MLHFLARLLPLLQTRPKRRTNGSIGVGICEAHSLRCQSIKVWCVNIRVAVAAQSSRAMLIRENPEYIRFIHSVILVITVCLRTSAHPPLCAFYHDSPAGFRPRRVKCVPMRVQTLPLRCFCQKALSVQTNSV